MGISIVTDLDHAVVPFSYHDNSGASPISQQLLVAYIFIFYLELGGHDFNTVNAS